MAFCLIPALANRFKAALRDGTINPDKLMNMSSAERHDFFAKLLGEEVAGKVNEEFESKMLLKNKQIGIISWAQKMLKDQPDAQRDIISKVAKMDKILSPADEKSFLSDLAEKKLGTHVTFDEAKKITELSQNIARAKEMDLTDKNNQIAYGNAINKMKDYISSVKPKDEISTMNIAKGIVNIPRQLMTIGDLTAPLKRATSFVFSKDFYSAVGEMGKDLFSEANYQKLRNEITGDPDSILLTKNGLKLNILSERMNDQEAAWMNNLAENIPGLKQISRASQRGFVGFLNRLRYDSAKGLLENARLAGEDVGNGSDNIKNITKVINTFTGSASLGRFENAASDLNAAFFDPRKIMSTVNKFDPRIYLDPRTSSSARQFAIKRLISQVGISTGILTLARMSGLKIGTDPKSSDFGTVYIGNNSIDTTGGDKAYLTLLARLATGQTTSATTGITKPLTGGIGGQTRSDVAIQYLRNKLSPAAGVLADWATQDQNKPFKITDEMKKVMIPMTINEFIKLYTDPNSDSSNPALVGALSAFGASATNYSSTTDWSTKTSKQMNNFRSSVSSDTFQKANDEYNQQYNDYFKKLQAKQSYKDLPDNEKQTAVNELKKELETAIIDKYTQ